MGTGVASPVPRNAIGVIGPFDALLVIRSVSTTVDAETGRNCTRNDFLVRESMVKGYYTGAGLDAGLAIVMDEMLSCGPP